MLFQILGFALLLPFFGWAIYLLRRRFVYYEENTIVLEAGTAAGVLVFFWVETTVLKYALGQQQMLLYLFAVLGLVVAGFALYAHVIISLASRILVDMVIPGETVAANQPRFGPVESLERMDDFEGALREYLVLARIYPRNFEVLKRTGRIHEMLDRYDEAATWYGRARNRAANDREALTAVNRLCAIYDNELEAPEEADAQLVWFIDSFPDSLDRDIVRDRLERRALHQDHTLSTELESLDEHPFGDEKTDSEAPAGPDMPSVGPEMAFPTQPEIPPARPALIALDTEGALEPGTASGGEPEQTSAKKKRASLGLEKQRVGESTRESAATRKNGAGAKPTGPKASHKKKAPASKPSLEALSSLAPTESKPEPEPRPTKPRSKLSLDAMDKDEEPSG